MKIPKNVSSGGVHEDPHQPMAYYKLCKAPVISSSPTNQHPFFTGRMSFLSPNQQCQSTEGKNITFHGLAYPKLSWILPTLSLTTNSSWLSCGRVAMPLISPLMPVPVCSVRTISSNSSGPEMPRSCTLVLKRS